MIAIALMVAARVSRRGGVKDRMITGSGPMRLRGPVIEHAFPAAGVIDGAALGSANATGAAWSARADQPQVAVVANSGAPAACRLDARRAPKLTAAMRGRMSANSVVLETGAPICAGWSAVRGANAATLPAPQVPQ